MRTLARQSKRARLIDARDRFRDRLAARPRATHREIFADTDDRYIVELLRDPVTNEVHADQDGVISVATAFFTDLMRSRSGQPCAGKFLPHEMPRAYPWHAAGCPDKFTLRTGANVPGPDGKIPQTTSTLLTLVCDRAAFHATLHRLPSNKAPGPDCVPNELLSILPDDTKEIIFQFLCVCYITHHTPTAWKQSNTTLLYKKGDPLSLGNYRPIGLTNTIYKVWTAMLTRALTEYAERYNVLSSCQEGFRRGRGTARQIQTLVRTIEDAALTSRDLYTLYVDFSSAFNTMGHDQLLCFMYDLGFPPDIIHVVADIYRGAHTSVLTAHGPTPPIPVQRGSIQGDTLSPVLFATYIEPLLRWLTVGGRGYRYGCLGEAENAVHCCASLALADDLAVTADDPDNMPVQAMKITLFNDFACMDANSTKCAVTGVLHGTAKRSRSVLTRERHVQILCSRIGNGKIKLQGRPIPFLAPDKPYKYLGIPLSHTLDWSHLLQYTLERARDRCARIRGSLASPRQCLHMLQTVVKPGIIYGFHLAAFTPADICLLDSVLARTAKRCFGLQASAPTAAILLPHTHMGLGLGSLMTDYVQRCADMLVRSLNDDGRLGAVTGALMSIQQHLAGTHATNLQQLAKHLRHYTSLKQIALSEQYGISLLDKGEQVQLHVSRLTAVLRQVAPATLPHVLARLILPLHSLGLELCELVDQSTRRHVINTEQLARIAAAKGRVCRDEHRAALNKITALLCGAPISTPSPGGRPPCAALPIEARMLSSDIDVTSLGSRGVSPGVAALWADHIAAAARGPGVDGGDTPAAQATRHPTTTQPTHKRKLIDVEIDRSCRDVWATGVYLGEVQSLQWTQPCTGTPPAPGGGPREYVFWAHAFWNAARASSKALAAATDTRMRRVHGGRAARSRPPPIHQPTAYRQEGLA
jgi:hypothetical protein